MGRKWVRARNGSARSSGRRSPWVANASSIARRAGLLLGAPPVLAASAPSAAPPSDDRTPPDRGHQPWVGAKPPT